MRGCSKGLSIVPSGLENLKRLKSLHEMPSLPGAPPGFRAIAALIAPRISEIVGSCSHISPAPANLENLVARARAFSSVFLSYSLGFGLIFLVSGEF